MKYHSQKVIIDDQVFDSRKEANRYLLLKRLEKDGLIYGLQTQCKFVLIPAQRGPDIIGKRGGRKPGKLVEKECAYIADFVYTDATSNKTIVEDTKGFKTKDYIIKRKLMLWVHGIKILEV